MGSQEDDEMGDLSNEEKEMVEEEFAKLYVEDSRFKNLLGGTSVSNLNLRDKYELIIAYTKKIGGDDDRLIGNRRESSDSAVEIDG